ncbi:hypothetical protein [Methylobrevis pamukkalensis]|uniref:hypothetical protein n=1 Tax=Methylobrevis pamukkalensis TaxID=1439726 RepID=UPI0008462264|nr:hypothetical protein [Methylobrevis pamukkalensis]
MRGLVIPDNPLVARPGLGNKLRRGLIDLLLWLPADDAARHIGPIADAADRLSADVLLLPLERVDDDDAAAAFEAAGCLHVWAERPAPSPASELFLSVYADSDRVCRRIPIRPEEVVALLRLLGRAEAGRCLQDPGFRRTIAARLPGLSVYDALRRTVVGACPAP